MLEAEYQNALADVGLGHEGLKELEEYETWKKEQRRLQEEVAGIKGVQIMQNSYLKKSVWLCSCYKQKTKS